MASMFTKAKNNHFENASFTINTTNFNAAPGQALDTLYKRVSPNAILNAGGRADEVRCYPGTREEVIGLVNKWRLNIQNNITANQIFWLSGPAGAGKTAIVQTVAEKWKSEGIHTANFFFFRTDPTRGDVKAFVSTLLYQIFDFVPAARHAVDEVLRLKPRLLDAGLEEQVEELICNIFRSTQLPFPHKIVLLIDGLDECDSETKASQKQILNVLEKLVRQEDLPFLVLVASRAEPQISAAFAQLTRPVQSVFLDDQYRPSADIHLFVTAEFEKIKKSHPHAALLKSDWPSESDIDAIVQKSSGQFIYAATIMRFLAQSSAVPSLSLQKVHNIVPFAKTSPFSHLDAFYTHILQQADDDEAVRDILSFTLFRQEPPSHSYSVLDRRNEYLLPSTNDLLQLYNPRYTESLFMSCISDISSIVRIRNGRLVFYHASLSDFLIDQSRSNLLHVDIREFAAKILPALYRNYHTLDDSVDRTSAAHLCLDLFFLIQRPTPEITHTLRTAVHPSEWQLSLCGLSFPREDFLKRVVELYYDRDTKSYKQILKHWIQWARDGDRDHLLKFHYQSWDEEWRCILGLRSGSSRSNIPLLRIYLWPTTTRREMYYSYINASHRLGLRFRPVVDWCRRNNLAVRRFWIVVLISVFILTVLILVYSIARLFALVYKRLLL